MTHILSSFDPGRDKTEERLTVAVSRGIVETGLAQRVRLVLALLTADDPISGELLGQRLGLTRAAVHKHIDQLRYLGFAIESAAGSGYRLSESSDNLLCAEAALPYVLQSFDVAVGWTAGLPYLYRESCASTNVVLKQGEESLASGAVAVTEHQTAGRGRLGRTWSDEIGKEVMFSALLRPALAPGQAHLLSLAAALAVAQTLEQIPGLEDRVRVKWPNDVLIDGGKVCGILVEGSMDADQLHWAVAGIGVNVNGEAQALAAAIAERGDEGGERRPRPMSLKDALGKAVPRARLLAALLHQLTSVWTALEGGPEAKASLLSELGKRDALAGCLVEIASGGQRKDLALSGEARGFGPEGQLLIRTSDGSTVQVAAGDVTIKSVNPMQRQG